MRRHQPADLRQHDVAALAAEDGLDDFFGDGLGEETLAAVETFEEFGAGVVLWGVLVEGVVLTVEFMDLGVLWCKE